MLAAAVVALCACAKAGRADEPVGTASNAGGDAGADTSTPMDAGRLADAGGKAVRIFVPFPDCSENNPASGVAVEGCDCAAPDGTLCCTDGTVFECTGFGWRSLQASECLPDGVADPAPPDAGWDPSQPAQCRRCAQGSAGCGCRSDATCDQGLVCLEGLCGTPAPRD